MSRHPTPRPSSQRPWRAGDNPCANGFPPEGFWINGYEYQAPSPGDCISMEISKTYLVSGRTGPWELRRRPTIQII